jgi:hypothetical protein
VAQAPDGAAAGEHATSIESLKQVHRQREQGCNGSDRPGESLANYPAPSRDAVDRRGIGNADE